MNSRQRSPSKETLILDWQEIEKLLYNIYEFIKRYNNNHVMAKSRFIPVPRGGLIPCTWLSYKLNIPMMLTETFIAGSFVSNSLPSDVFIDGVIDTGLTCKQCNKNLITVIRKPWSPPTFYSALETEKFIIFPWEKE